MFEGSLPPRRRSSAACCPQSAAWPWHGPLDRRTLVKVGGLGIASAFFPSALRAEADRRGAAASARSVVFLNMMGGVTHIDSFDPKPEAPEEIRGTLRPIATALAGVQFSEALPHLARMADKLAVVRSYSHGNNDHFMSQAYALSGRPVPRNRIFDEPNIGSVVARLLGPRNLLPGYIAVPGITRPGPPPTNLFVGGWLGRQYEPFCVGGPPEQPDFTATKKLDDPPSELAESLEPRALWLLGDVDADRLLARSRLRQAVDRRLRQAEQSPVLATVDSQYRDALALLSSADVRAAFDLQRETEVVRDRYGRTKIGGRCLLARRLVEAGARFVMVDYGYDNDYGNLWDNHNAVSQNHPPICEMALRGYHLAGIDRAFAALVTDLEDRGLLESTLVVFITEFGRTPKINARGGRDHWGPAGSIFFSGGGVRTAQVIGRTDRNGAYPVTPGYTPGDVAATIYRALGVDTEARLYDQQNRPHFVLPEGQAIPGLLA